MHEQPENHSSLLIERQAPILYHSESQLSAHWKAGLNLVPQWVTALCSLKGRPQCCTTVSHSSLKPGLNLVPQWVTALWMSLVS